MKIKFCLLLVSLFASVSCFATEMFQVSTSVFKDGELVASPVMVVEAEKEAAMTIGTDLSYALTLTENEDETVNIVAKLTIDGDTTQPELTVAYDKEATMEIGTQKMTLLVSKVDS